MFKFIRKKILEYDRSMLLTTPYQILTKGELIDETIEHATYIKDRISELKVYTGPVIDALMIMKGFCDKTVHTLNQDSVDSDILISYNTSIYKLYLILKSCYPYDNINSGDTMYILKSLFDVFQHLYARDINHEHLKEECLRQVKNATT